VHGALRQTYAEFYARCRRLASALAQRGIGLGDTVTVMLANTPPCWRRTTRADDRRGAAFAQHAARRGVSPSSSTTPTPRS
jgi:acyl-CoA synthetase (AMP-forming)/AMP-acid ligase II